MRGFWWGSKEGKRKTCWVAWEEMTKTKIYRRIGIQRY